MDSSQHVRAIASLIQTVDAGSFAAAGRQLGVTSAAISKNVAALEKALGVRLVNRTTRTLKLTEEGQAFVRQARVALETLNAAVDTVAAQRTAPTGRVRISTSAAFGRDHVLPTLPSLLARYPGLSVEVDFDDRVVDIVRDRYDIAVRGGNIPDSTLVTRQICRLNTVLVASPDYLGKHGVPQTPEALRRHQLIARRFLSGQVASWSFKGDDGSITTLDPTSRAMLTLSAPESLVQAACDSVGIAEVGVHLALDRLRSGSLKIVLHKFHQPGTYEMVMQYPHRALVAPRVQVTVRHLLEALAADNKLHVPMSALDVYTA
ncbi:LysR family transcriptional regulator [Burkholderia sp. MSMB1826]|uniref:LysR family transcriptional regulator n=1 Tax=Burkholderia sp. MSMB1826 TaxID=1637875 RepID=UPI0009E81267|nr:LysR family transcriptional regulator [Burkholderia sp. MSMB1826]